MNLSLELNLILVLATLDPYAGSALSEYQAGEILIQVSAVGVTRTEKLWSTTSHYADGAARSKAIPGHEFSGIGAIAQLRLNSKVATLPFGLHEPVPRAMDHHSSGCLPCGEISHMRIWSAG